MRNAIFMLLLASVSNGAVAVLGQVEGNGMAAEWIETGRSDICIVYSSPVTIGREGDLVKIWELLDHKAPYLLANGKPHLSIKRQSEYDCKQSQWRTLSLSFYSGHMATGELVYSSADPDNWHPIPMGSVGDALMQFACGKR
jgi:hypothetical protein